MPNTSDYLRRTVERLNAMPERPDIVVATGDLTERGSPHEYRRLRSILRELEIPHVLLCGNHDDRAAMRRAFRDHTYLTTFDAHASFVVESWPLRIVGLDSTDPRYIGGYVDDERIEWLDAELSAKPHTPTILAMHHPPFVTGIWAMDAHGFVMAERLGDVVRRHPQIVRIICGHVHTVLMRPWNGAVACSAPSTSPQFVIGRSKIGIGIEAAGFLLHEWTWNADVRTRLVRIDGAQRLIA